MGESNPAAVGVNRTAYLHGCAEVCVCVSLFVIPPAPMVSGMPPMVNAPAVLLNVMLRALKGTFTKGASRTTPAKTKSVFTRSLTGAVLSTQLGLLLKLLLMLPPSHVSVTARGVSEVSSSEAMPRARMRGVYSHEHACAAGARLAGVERERPNRVDGRGVHG